MDASTDGVREGALPNSHRVRGSGTHKQATGSTGVSLNATHSVYVPAVAVATASPLGREIENLGLASLAARVAAAARRALAGLGIDPRRDTKVLESAETLLRTGAAVLRGDSVPPTADETSRHESYAFARITHSALSHRTARPDGLDDARRREATAKALLELADDLRILRTEPADSPAVESSARELSNVFGRISTNVLSNMGSPGDSIGGTK